MNTVNQNIQCSQSGLTHALCVDCPITQDHTVCISSINRKHFNFRFVALLIFEIATNANVHSQKVDIFVFRIV